VESKAAQQSQAAFKRVAWLVVYSGIHPMKTPARAFPKKGRYAVYVVNLPAEHDPAGPTDLPGDCESTAYAKNLLADQAAEFARVFNQRAIIEREQGRWDRRWAIVLTYLRPDRFGRGREKPFAGRQTI